MFFAFGSTFFAGAFAARSSPCTILACFTGAACPASRRLRSHRLRNRLRQLLRLSNPRILTQSPQPASHQPPSPPQPFGDAVTGTPLPAASPAPPAAHTAYPPTPASDKLRPPLRQMLLKSPVPLQKVLIAKVHQDLTRLIRRSAPSRPPDSTDPPRSAPAKSSLPIASSSVINRPIDLHPRRTRRQRIVRRIPVSTGNEYCLIRLRLRPAYPAARRSHPPAQSRFPCRTNATGVRSTINTRIRFGSSRITVACATHGNLSSSALRSRQRNLEDIPLHILAKDAQQLRPRQMRIPLNLNRRRCRNHKLLIVQQITPRTATVPAHRSPKQHQPAASAAIRPHSRSRHPRNRTRTPALRRRHRSSTSSSVRHHPQSPR